MTPVRVLTLGVMTTHKGLGLLCAAAQRAIERRMPFEFVHLGPVLSALDPAKLPFVVRGAYDDTELLDLMAREQPDVVWFPVRWPETFSYTLSAALASGVRLAVPAIGALPERVAGVERAHVYRVDATTDQILEVLATAARTVVPRYGVEPPRAAPHFYETTYLEVRRARAAIQPTVITYETRGTGGQYDACAYHRVRLPLRHGALALDVRSAAEPEVVVGRRLTVVQRDAVRDVETARRLIETSRANGAALVYETDDDLFGITPDHPEYAMYRPRLAAAAIIAQHADAVWTTTRALATALCLVNPAVTVFENALDERLWFDDIESLPPPADGVTRILYAGTLTHADDLAVLENAARSLERRYGSKVRLEIAGIASGNPPWCDRAPIPFMAGRSHPHFARWMLEHRNRWTLAVAPLRDTTFNRSKSAVKYLEYSAIGLPSIVSDVGPYAELRQGGAPARFVDTNGDWAEAIEALLSSVAERTELGIAARNRVRRTGTLASAAERRRAALDALGVYR